MERARLRRATIGKAEGGLLGRLSSPRSLRQVLLQIPQRLFAELTTLFEVALPADGFVFDGGVVVDDNLVAFEDGDAVDAANIHHGFAAAVADGLELFKGMGELEKAFATGEAFAAEVGAQAVANAGDIVVDDRSKELVDLGGGQELRFVDKNAIEVTCSDGIANERTAIGVDTDHGIDGTTDAQTTHDFVVAFGIDAGFQE